MSELFIVEKFGGGGSQSAEHIEQNVAHIQAEPNLIAAVFSGPGGLSGRATDRMISLTEAHASEADFLPVFEEIEEQFSSVAPRGTSHIVNSAMGDIRYGLRRGYGYDWLKARPEMFIWQIYGHLLEEAGVEVELVDPVGSIYADSFGRLDVERTVNGLGIAMARHKLNLIPGFSAMNPNWNMVNLGRGSTDTVAAITARTVKQLNPDADVDFILRKDDVHGYLRVSPKIRPDAAVAPELSIPEAETLALSGAEVVHPAVMNLIEGTGVRLLVRNTFDLDHPGTAIVPRSERHIDPEHPIVGIASKPVVAYKWQEATTDALPGSVEAVSGVFTKLGVSITEIQTGSGGVIRVYISDKEALEYGSQIKRALEAIPNTGVHVEDNLELVVLVGEGLRDATTALDVPGQLKQAAKDTETKINGFWSNGDEPNLYVAVDRGKAHQFMDQLYETFF